MRAARRRSRRVCDSSEEDDHGPTSTPLPGRIDREWHGSSCGRGSQHHWMMGRLPLAAQRSFIEFAAVLSVDLLFCCVIGPCACQVVSKHIASHTALLSMCPLLRCHICLTPGVAGAGSSRTCASVCSGPRPLLRAAAARTLRAPRSQYGRGPGGIHGGAPPQLRRGRCGRVPRLCVRSWCSVRGTPRGPCRRGWVVLRGGHGRRARC